MPGVADTSGVVVIVVNYRTAAITVRCLESVARSSAPPVRIIIVDNASGDESVETLRSFAAGRAHVSLIEREENDGFTGGMNAGLLAAATDPSPFALLLNSDTVLDVDAIRLLTEEMTADQSVAAVCPRIYFGDAPDRLWFGGGRFSLWHGRPIHVGLGKPASGGWTAPRDLTFATGCAMLVRRRALPPAPFDTSLFSYAEDLDLSLRLRRDGHRIRYLPTAMVWHFEGASHRQTGGQALRFYLNTRNLLRVLARHARWYHWITLGPLFMVDVVGRGCAVAVRDRDAPIFAAVLRGVWHALRGGRHPIERSRAVIGR